MPVNHACDLVFAGTIVLTTASAGDGDVAMLMPTPQLYGGAVHSFSFLLLVLTLDLAAADRRLPRCCHLLIHKRPYRAICLRILVAADRQHCRHRSCSMTGLG